MSTATTAPTTPTTSVTSMTVLACNKCQNFCARCQCWGHRLDTVEDCRSRGHILPEIINWMRQGSCQGCQVLIAHLENNGNDGINNDNNDNSDQ